MIMKRKSLFVGIMLMSICCFQSKAANINPDLLTKTWKAFWISMPGEDLSSYGVYEFKKEFTLDSTPESFVVHVSADNRYKLFVNENLVSVGPSLGDLDHWNFQTVDIATNLIAGNNVISAIVWNDGEYKPINQFSSQTAFILQSDEKKSNFINTNTTWQCRRLNAYSPLKQTVYGFYAVGPGELVEYNKEPSAWQKPLILGTGSPKGTAITIYSTWELVPSEIPEPQMSLQRLESVRKAQGITLPSSFPKQTTDVTIPSNSSVSILLDQQFLTNAYFHISFSKGKDASINIVYAETLREADAQKGNRDEVDGKTMFGRKDSIISNGLTEQQFTTLSWRNFRYVQLDIVTADEPLVINDIYGVATAYPFEKKSTAVTADDTLNSILEIGWRTARLCAMETYFDCPYYEQLQYVGDTRVQAMISYFNTDDDRLARKAITQIDYSRSSDGITKSRYPSSQKHFIPTFSLAYVGMLYDFYRYRDDLDFIKGKLQGMRDILNFFSLYQQEDGSLKNVPYWNFTDWPENNKHKWRFGISPSDRNGNSAIQDLQLLIAYQNAAEIEEGIGETYLANNYRMRAEQLSVTVRSKYYDPDCGLFSDNADKKVYSEHANSLAILAGVVEGEEAMRICQKMIDEHENLVQASIYFLYYVNQAVTKAGLGDDYLNRLDIWRENMRYGLTTWGEDSDVANTRSDCHAWGASPNIEFYRTILGIDSSSPAFQTLRIEPHLGTLTDVSGTMPHPNGTISASYKKKGNYWAVEIILPENTTGIFIWNGKEYELNSGSNSFKLQ